MGADPCRSSQRYIRRLHCAIVRQPSDRKVAVPDILCQRGTLPRELALLSHNGSHDALKFMCKDWFGRCIQPEMIMCSEIRA